MNEQLPGHTLVTDQSSLMIIDQQILFKAFRSWIANQALTEHIFEKNDISDDVATRRALIKWCDLTGYGSLKIFNARTGMRTDLHAGYGGTCGGKNYVQELPKDSFNRVHVPVKTKEDQAVTAEQKPHISVPVPRTVHRSYNGPTLYELAEMQAKARENK